MSDISITEWIDRLREGDDVAAQKVWEGYYEKLVHLARRRLGASPRRVSDEEDVALSALNSFCRSAAAGRFPQLENSDDLWRVLFTITERKAIRHMQTARRLKRGGGNVAGESAFTAMDSGAAAGIGQAAVDDEPTPEVALEVAERLESLLGALDDPILRRVALARMEGFTNKEIAEQLDCSTRSVKRHLQTIRTIWVAKELV